MGREGVLGRVLGLLRRGGKEGAKEWRSGRLEVHSPSEFNDMYANYHFYGAVQGTFTREHEPVIDAMDSASALGLFRYGKLLEATSGGRTLSYHIDYGWQIADPNAKERDFLSTVIIARQIKPHVQVLHPETGVTVGINERPPIVAQLEAKGVESFFVPGIIELGSPTDMPPRAA